MNRQMADSYSTARQEFDEGVAQAGEWIVLANSLPHGSPGQINTEQDALNAIEKMSLLNTQYGFVDEDIAVLAVKSTLERDPKGTVAKTADNIYNIMRFDPKYRWVRYNLITANCGWYRGRHAFRPGLGMKGYFFIHYRKGETY